MILQCCSASGLILGMSRKRLGSGDQVARCRAPASRFIGREREKSIVRDLLTGGDARLVTQVGAGGIGKTRLAREVGSELRGKFEGVVMVAREEVSSADLVVSSIASSLGIP
jgi:hypothetical protein